jgi:hypothetical protein
MSLVERGVGRGRGLGIGLEVELRGGFELERGLCAKEDWSVLLLTLRRLCEED